MDQLSEQIAKGAGVDPEYVERLVGLGILDDEVLSTEQAVRRVRLVHAVEGAGLPLESLGRAIEQGVLSLDVMESPSSARWASLTDTTFKRASEETGVPVELLMVVREATGAGPPHPEDRMRRDELDVVPLVRLQHEQGFNPQTIERSLRVAGESLRRIVETESDWWRDEVMAPVLNVDRSALAEKYAELSPELAKRSDQALLAIYHGQQAGSWVRNIIEEFETALSRAGIEGRRETVPAICFLDLTGYTRLTTELGDVTAAAVATDLATIVQRTSSQYGGTPVKWLGDGVMFHFPEPGRGAVAALEMVAAAESAGLPPLHGGLHAGPVLFREGDYFGRTVNIAARIVDRAEPGEILVTEAVVDASADFPVSFTDVGPVELKGIGDPIRLYRAGPADRAKSRHPGSKLS